jgi:hypothetical protein
MQMPKPIVLVNFVLFQLCWFACVLGAANGYPWWAFALVVVAVGWQCLYAPQPKQALLLVLLVTVAGGVLDQVMVNHDLVRYEAHGWSDKVVPVWILALWISFASTLNVSMRWLQAYPVVAVLFGAIGGPLAYFAAQKLGAVLLPQVPLSFVALGLAWGGMMLFLIKLAKRYDGYPTI